MLGPMRGADSARFLQDAERLLAQGVGWAGLTDDALAFVLPRIRSEDRWLVVVDGADRAHRLVRALRLLHPSPEQIELFAADDVKPYDGFSPDPSVPAARLRALRRVEAGGPVVVVCPAPALLQRVPDRVTREAGTRLVQPADTVDRDELTRWLTEAGYMAAGRVDAPCTFAVRGDVVDVWPSSASGPARIDLFDDEVEEIRRFDPGTQRTVRPLKRVLLLPAREERLDRDASRRLHGELARLMTEQARGAMLRRRVLEDVRAGIRFAGIEAWLPALVSTEAPLAVLGGLRALVIEPDEVGSALRDADRAAVRRWRALEDDERPLVSPEERYVSAGEVLDGLEGAHEVLSLPLEGRAVDLGSRPADDLIIRGGAFEPVAQRIRDLIGLGVRVGFIAESKPRLDRLDELLRDHEIAPKCPASVSEMRPGQVSLVRGDLPSGFLAPASGWVLVPVRSLFGERRRSATSQAVHARFDVALSSIAQVKEGDHVVHRVHGIGKFLGIRRLAVEGDLEWKGDRVERAHAEQDFVSIEYRDGAQLFLPATQIADLSRYRASGTATIRLDRLGGTTWANRQKRVRDAILHMAQSMLSLQAKRELATRPPLPAGGGLSKAFAAAFPYVETPDQAAAIDAIDQDLDRTEPMDHLLVGDVGFGKTEVAMRAAARVVEAGKQVAVLCPTTVLALQHWERFKERFASFPVRIEMVSRLRARDEEREVLADLRAGKVDILIGTTKVLSRNTRFADLGLLVVDEEHRYGVKQKNRLKKMREALDVLSMSATPIPRTLELGMHGLQRMSVMATPPRDRLAVRTSLARMSETRVRDAIQSEMERGGQVFFVHNRVEDIGRLAERLQEWVPDARFQVAHGQLDAETLEKRLVGFIRRDFDVLVCTAIIESGIDLPNVNTILVHHAERFGLSQLYQLRGRVGRSSVRGRCLLLTSDNITREARKRLYVLVEHAQLGSGMQVALADLEIRGAGNLLGEAQSGNIEAVGYDMWVELLREAVTQARGELSRRRIDPQVEVPVGAFLPETMIPEIPERLEWYRRLATADTAVAVDGLVDALEDQFGDLPVEVRNLGGLHAVRAMCQDVGVARVSWLKVRAVFELHPSTRVTDADLDEVQRLHRKRFTVWRKDDEPTVIEVRFLPEEAERPFRFLRWALARLA